MDFYLPEDLSYTIVDSMKDSVKFVLDCCLTKYNGHYCAKSSFVDENGEPMLWHDFGNLEGPGWAANAVGGSYELLLFANYTKNKKIREIAFSILDHILEDGFINYETGFVYPYRNISENKFCLNFKHNNYWLCPGSLAKIGYQFLIVSDLVDEVKKKKKLLKLGKNLLRWIISRIEICPNGWFPRRITIDGKIYKERAEGGFDPIWDHSGDGLYIIQLMTELTKRKLTDYSKEIREKTDIFIKNEGFYGSINHDTYDDNENVSYAVAFRVLKEIGNLFNDEKIRDFAYNNSLAGLAQFELKEDRNGVATKGLLFMEKSWDTAYLWENAEASLAYLEAYNDTKEEIFLNKGLTILRAIAKHHHGEYGFLTEGVDWNNHVGAQHHFDGKEFGDIKYTEPFLNNLHITEPTIYYLSRILGT
ncbi:MAG: hypothetical protein N2380_10260 [bacterium]|nr:hypothetical protein [bacterium]